jgi:RND superfamily putative drug exporter
LLENLGRLMARRRWYVIGVWIAIAGLALPLAPRVGEVLRAGGISGGGLESDAAFERYQEDFGLPGSAISIVFHSDELMADDPEFVRAAELALHPLTELDYVQAILPFWDNPAQVAESGRTAYAAVVIDLDEEEAHQVVPEIRAAVGSSELETHVAGAAAFYTDIQATSENDLRRAEMIGLPFALLALLLVFGSLVAAGVPVVAGGISVIVGLAAVFLLGQVTSFSVFALNVVTLVGLGLGADYALFLVSRFREELGLYLQLCLHLQ